MQVKIPPLQLWWRGAHKNLIEFRAQVESTKSPSVCDAQDKASSSNEISGSVLMPAAQGNHARSAIKQNSTQESLNCNEPQKDRDYDLKKRPARPCAYSGLL